VKKPKAKKLSEAQLLLSIHLRELGFTRELEFEFMFAPPRLWRSDIALHNEKLLLEIDGGLYTGGHKRGKALEDDYEKQNVAQMLHYRILRFSNAQVLDGRAKEFLSKFFGMVQG
jgi:very-short-patch-repair endonuclease